MDKHNPSITPDLFQNGGLVNAMHNACAATLRCYVKDQDSPLGLSEVTFFGFEVSGATMYARVIQKLGLIVTSTDSDMALESTVGQSAISLQSVIVLALRGVGFTNDLLNEIDFVQASHEKLWSTPDADLVLEVLPFLGCPMSGSPSGFALDSAIELQPRLCTLGVYWQTAGSTSSIHLPTLLRTLRRERNAPCENLPRVLTPTGSMYSRTDGTLRVTSRPTGFYTRSVRCDVDTKKYIAYREGCDVKMFHLGDKPRSISKATTEGLGIILSAMWGVDSGFVGTEYSRLAYLTNHFAKALLVMTLTDKKGATWIVAKHRENWAASRTSAKSRATVVQIYT